MTSELTPDDNYSFSLLFEWRTQLKCSLEQSFISAFLPRLRQYSDMSIDTWPRKFHDKHCLHDNVDTKTATRLFYTFCKNKNPGEKKKERRICRRSSISGYISEEFMRPSASGPSCFYSMPLVPPPPPVFWLLLQPRLFWTPLFLALHHHTVYFKRTLHVKSQGTHAGVYTDDDVESTLPCFWLILNICTHWTWCF